MHLLILLTLMTVASSANEQVLATEEQSQCFKLAENKKNSGGQKPEPKATLPAASKLPGPDLIINGSFEQCPDFAGGHLEIKGPSRAIPGWEVTPFSIDEVSNWATPFGKRAIDLNGGNQGGMQQTFATEPGATYELRFYMGANVEGGPPIKTLSVLAAGKSVNFAFDGQGLSNSNMGWLEKVWRFVAKDRTTTLLIASTVFGGSHGPAIDNVSVRKVLEASAKLEPENQSSVVTQAPARTQDASSAHGTALKSEAKSGSAQFSDLATIADTKIRKSVLIAASRNILEANVDGLFHPNEPVNRADFTRWLLRTRQIPPINTDRATFVDVTASNPYFKEIEAASHQGLLQGFEEGDNKLFKPEQAITRQDFAALYCSFSGKKEKAEKLSDDELKQALSFNPATTKSGELTFRDAGEIDESLKKYVAVAQAADVLNQCFGVDPYSNNEELRLLHPNKKLSRAEAVNILWRLYGQ